HEVDHLNRFFDHAAQIDVFQRLVEALVDYVLEAGNSSGGVLHHAAEAFDSAAELRVNLFAAEQFDPEQHRVEAVIDVVRNSRSEFADRTEPLAAKELLIHPGEPLEGGNLLSHFDRQPADETSFRGINWKSDHEQVLRLPVLSYQFCRLPRLPTR